MERPSRGRKTRFSLARAPAQANRYSLAHRAGAEGLATAIFVFVGVGSVPAVLVTSRGEFTGADLGIVALTFGLIIAAMCYVFGPVSGCHINPAITIALAAVRRFPAGEVPAYVACQCAGAIAGAFGVWGIFADRGIDLGYGFGLTRFDPELVTWGSALLAEGLGTGVLLFVVLGLVDKTAPIGWAGLIIGLSVTALIVTLGPITGGAINPARALGPLFVSTIAGGVHNWDQWIGYVCAELVGACVAAFVYVVATTPSVDAEDQAAA